MNLNPPAKKFLGAVVIIAAVGVVLEILLLIAKALPDLSLASFLLVLLAFVLICLGLTVRNL